MKNIEINIYKKNSNNNNNNNNDNNNNNNENEIEKENTNTINKRSKFDDMITKNEKQLKKENLNNSIDFDIDKTIYQFKIVLVGDINVGKTSILNKFIDKRFSKEHRATINIEFKIKTIKINSTTICDLKIWDTCGDEKYFSLTKNYFKDSDGIILVYDITSKKTFFDLNKWLELIKNYIGKINIILVGNKNDLKNKREVSEKDANNFAIKNNLKFYEISAKEDLDVINNIFFDLSYDLIKNKNNEIEINNENNNDENNNVIDKGFNLNKNDGNKKVNNSQKKSCC
jgi:small GTP-binding protein